jgi:hypothetical protein
MPARTSHRTDSPESHKKLLLLNCGQAQVMKTKVFVPPTFTGHSPNSRLQGKESRIRIE